MTKACSLSGYERGVFFINYEWFNIAVLPTHTTIQYVQKHRTRARFGVPYHEVRVNTEA